MSHLRSQSLTISNTLLVVPPDKQTCGLAEEDDDGDAPIPTVLNTALVEALCYPDLLDDTAVAASLGDALLTLSATYEMALDDGSGYPGLYRLLATPRPDLRRLVGRSRLCSADSHVSKSLLHSLAAFKFIMCQGHWAAFVRHSSRG